MIGENGEQLGIVSLEQALIMAREKDLDLAEVAPNMNPPVCKILDYGKYQYHQNKIEAKHRRMQKKMEVKGVRLGFKTGDHDMLTKANQAKKFLAAGNSVKVSLVFKGREIMYKELGRDKMLKFFEGVKEAGTMETSPKVQGNTLLMILTPNKS